MLQNEYLNAIIRRGNELAALEQAALSFPEKQTPVRWMVGAAFGLLIALFPSVCTAHAFFQMI